MTDYRNLSGLFDTSIRKLAKSLPTWGRRRRLERGIFNMPQSLSETVIVPIAAAILAFVMCYELIQMIVEKNNLHDFDTGCSSVDVQIFLPSSL